MKPGRELDALVAVEVMGEDLSVYPDHLWKKSEDGEVDVFAMDSDLHSGPRCTRCWFSYCVHCKETIEPCQRTPSYYSTNIAAAWEVVPAIQSKVLFSRPLVFRLEGIGEQWEATFFDPFAGSPADPGTFPYIKAEGSTASEAICLAALKAVGYKLEEHE